MSLDFYRAPIDFSDAGIQARFFDDLPHDVAGLAAAVQGLLIHEHMTGAYGVNMPQARHAEAHIRPVEDILAAIAARDPRPLTTPRAPAGRHVCVCRSFTLLLVAMLRHQGVPARARCGFAAYFEKGKFIDHWIAEYWNADQARWIMVDAQIDGRQREMFGIAFDTLDVGRDRFLVAGDAWALCRSGKAVPDAFGILDMHGLWFLAGNLVRDLAALNKREMLPWDVWGILERSRDDLDLALFDRLARLTRTPDRHFDEILALYHDPRLAVPGTVFNAVLNRAEAA